MNGNDIMIRYRFEDLEHFFYSQDKLRICSCGVGLIRGNLSHVTAQASQLLILCLVFSC
jgi:hypothetical protein